MARKEEEPCITVKARAALIPLWEKCARGGMRGRPWGDDVPENLFGGSNTILAMGDEAVSVSKRDGRLIIHEFRRTVDTDLGSEVRKLLQEAKLLD